MNDEQIGVLTSLLNEYQDVFATSTNPFGRTSITQRRIITGESKPIKQGPRRLPLQLKEKVEEEVEKMLAKGTIELSVAGQFHAQSQKLRVFLASRPIIPVSSMNMPTLLSHYMC